MYLDGLMCIFLRAVARFLMYPDGLTEIINLVKSMLSSVPTITKDRVLHGGSVVSVLLNKAQDLEKARGKGFSGIGRQTKEESLAQAALIYAKLGHSKSFLSR